MTATVRLAGAAALALLLAAPSAALAAEGKKDVLDPNPTTAIVTLVVFLALLAILWKFAWGPIAKGLDKREEDQFKALDEARLAREEAAALRVKIEAEGAKAREELKALMDEARRDAEQLRTREREAGVKDAQAERERARREIGAAKDAALKEISERAVDLAAVLSAKTLRREVTADDHRRLLDESLAELAQVSKPSA